MRSPVPPSAQAPERRSGPLALARDPPGWLATLILAAVFLGLTVWTWGRWFHLYIDYGRELYVPWRLSEGDVLYRDIAWFHGPLSAYGNAVAFALLGVGIRTQTLVNLALIAAVTWLMWQIGRALSDRLVALVASVFWLVAFAFQYVEWSGNFNWVAPYAHELTHGVALSLLAVWCLRWLEPRPRLALLASGVCLGLCFLTKAEVSLAATVAVVAGAVAGAEDRRRGLRSLWRLAIAAAVPIVVAFALLATAMPAGDALRGTLGSWLYTFLPELRRLTYYEFTVGTYDVGESLFGIGSWLATHAGTLLPGVLCAFLFGAPTRWRSVARAVLPILLFTLALGQEALLARRVLPGLVPPFFGLLAFGGLWLLSLSPLAARVPLWLVAALAGAVMLAAQWQDIVWEHAFRPLVLYVALATAVALWSAWRERGGTAHPPRALAVAFPVLSLTLLAKIFLWVRVHHYGFALAAPAALLSLVLLLHHMPRAVARSGGAAVVARGTALGFVVVTMTGLCARYEHNFMHGPYGPKTQPFATGADRFYAHANPVTELFAKLGSEIAASIKPDESMVVIPEGVMFNYLCRRVNPTRHLNFMPPELIMFGEDRIVADFEQRPPKWIVVVHRPSPEYATPGTISMFGHTFGKKIFRWILDHYRVFAEAGNPPLMHEDQYGVLIMQRKTGS